MAPVNGTENHLKKVTERNSRITTDPLIKGLRTFEKALIASRHIKKNI